MYHSLLHGEMFLTVYGYKAVFFLSIPGIFSMAQYSGLDNLLLWLKKNLFQNFINKITCTLSISITTFFYIIKIFFIHLVKEEIRQGLWKDNVIDDPIIFHSGTVACTAGKIYLPVPMFQIFHKCVWTTGFLFETHKFCLEAFFIIPGFFFCFFQSCHIF